MTPRVRTVEAHELDRLIDLYRHLNPEDDYSGRARIEAAWSGIQSGGGFRCLGVEEDGEVASSCCLAVIPNLTRGGSPIGFIENVITRPESRRRGYAGRVLREAVKISWESGCYKVVLMSAIHRIEAHPLYEKIGFRKDTKFGYEMRRP